MGDMTPAEEMEQRASHCHLFDSSMRSEARRLSTFRLWPSTSPVAARDLVKAGFFFVGPRDEVQCFCCGGVLEDWAAGDCPVAEHLKFFPSCKFICGEDVGNQEMFPLQEIFDTVDGQFLSLLPGLESEETALPNEPEYPEMVTEEMRLSTFQNWPRSTDLHPEQLARAGFFYTGRGDVVRCFYCNGGLRNWSIGGDPWREHALWYPECEFLLQSKGREFVRSVQDSLSNTSISPGDSWDQLEHSSFAFQDPLRNWELQTPPPWNQPPVGQEGFVPSWAAHPGEQSWSLSGIFCLAEPDPVFQLLLSAWKVISSAERSRDADQGETEPSSSRRESQSVEHKESEESGMSTEEQLRRLREERMCKVCMDRDVAVVFVPCGHLVACGECALNLRSCPICRAAIRGTVRTFMS